jgi:1-acyl-sn-glycerol-3-phosphate acyltransferase
MDATLPGPDAERPRSDPLYRTVVGLALTTFEVMRWHVDVSGEEHIPRSGPAIIASNHIGYLDFLFLGLAGRRQGRFVRFMAIQAAFDHWAAGPLLRGMRHIPVDRRGDPAAAFDRAVGALRTAEVVGIHPESKLSPSLMPMAAKTGAARMALATGAPLIPAAVWGSQRLFPHRRRPKVPRHVSIAVRLGPPVDVHRSDDCADLTGRLMGRIGGLVDEAIATYPDRPVGVEDPWWWPAHLGGTAPGPQQA